MQLIRFKSLLFYLVNQKMSNNLKNSKIKQLKLAVLALFTLVSITSTSAQDDSNPWVIGFGLNNVDFYGSDDFNTQIKDFLGNTDWNVLPSVSRVSVDRYLTKGFSLQFAGSFK